MTRTSVALGCLSLLLLAGSALAGSSVLDRTVTGTPAIQSIDVIRFGPDGVLFIADGRGAQVLAVAIPGSKAEPGFKEAVPGIDGKLAGPLGVPVKGIEIIDLAVHPVSHTAFVAVRKQAERKSLILTIDGSGKVGEFPLQDIKYAQLILPAAKKGGLSRVTDLAWAQDRLLVSGQANEEFVSKIYSIPGPLTHETKAAVYSTETYHVAHGKWETKAPMTALLPFVEAGKKYLAGSFACTPVVKYPLDDLKPGDVVKGISMIEMGSGNRPLNMFSYEKGGKNYVLMNTHRFHHQRSPFGPSPYWTVRFERDLLMGSEQINEKAIKRLDKNSKQASERIHMIPEFHGVMHMDRLGGDRVLTIKEDGKGGLTLVALPLP